MADQKTNDDQNHPPRPPEVMVTDEEWKLAYQANARSNPSDSPSDELDAFFKVGWEIKKWIERVEYEQKSNEDRLQDHLHFRTLFGAYTAAIATVCVAIISTGKTDGYLAWTISLLALSLPWMCGAIMLDHNVRVHQRRPRSKVLNLLTRVGLMLSLFGFILLLAMFSVFASLLLFASLALVWLYVDETTKLGGRENFEEL